MDQAVLSSVASPRWSQRENYRRKSTSSVAGDSVVRCNHRLFVYCTGVRRKDLDPREFAESTLNLRNHRGAISILENHQGYLPSEPTIFCLEKRHLRVR